MSHRDRSDAALAEHLSGFVGFITEGGQRQMSQSLYGVIRHIERVQNQFSFEIENHDWDQLAEWGWQANAIFFLPNMLVVDPAGNTLVDPANGAAEPQARLPYPGDAVKRKEHYENSLAAQGIPVAASLPPSLGASEVKLRDASAVALRLISLALVAVRGESLTQGEPIPVADMQTRFPAAFAALTPAEATFMAAIEPTPQEVTNHTWRYEAAALLHWALGRSDQLPYATEICDVAALTADVLQHNAEDLVAAATLRPTGDILNQLDLHLRLHWAVRDAASQDQEVPGALNPSVIQERRHALNWLVNFDGADWDDIDTPT